MIDVGVDAAVGREPEQVDVPASRARASNAPSSASFSKNDAVLDRRVDAHEVLVDDAARPDGQVADLGVPHLAGGRPDGLARGLERRMREAGPELVEDRRVRRARPRSRAPAARSPSRRG